MRPFLFSKGSRGSFNQTHGDGSKAEGEKQEGAAVVYKNCLGAQVNATSNFHNEFPIYLDILNKNRKSKIPVKFRH